METTLGDMAAGGFKPLVDDAMTAKLTPKIIRLSQRLLEIKKSGRFVLLRFHHDADGISGAFAISEVLRLSPYQQNSAVYSARDAVRDLSNIAHEERPVVILLDFGMNAESAEGLRLLKAAGAEVILIDHHPASKETTALADFFLTPWEFPEGENPSRYVAGYLASEVGRACGADTEGYARIACAGDKSSLLGHEEEAVRKALVLDYLAANSGFGNNLRFYKNVLAKRELFESMYGQADEKIGEAADKAMKGMKERKAGGVAVFIIELEKAVRKGEFPNRSKVTTRVFERLGRDEPMVVLGAGGRTIIIRMNDAATAKGVGADAIAKKLAATMRDFVESGGGHGKAGAVRIKEGFSGAVVEEILKILSSA